MLLAEELNFSRAAERAHLTQSAFNRRIQAAETQAGVKFFDRKRRSVKPTLVGKRSASGQRAQPAAEAFISSRVVSVQPDGP
ncbi:MAG: LysR family transcriptional regulator [Dechloromonas sp.]|nr:LysR family transcriptional regulator [Dechloromonas sp.]